ncbi:hypothetical protein ODJ79_29855 [Actinoplanes sp. KI2]|uniref:hypothetical protein n=1 Tax=Actinoplanes sp. KI2 TaxID=2983315 RepID=UPI0021D5C5E1|nr:hypothetical protein [Actinoplanes sp. KI2]MCU7727943.1 hypothetical protein [Actinoplanes sp. KI2]
MAGHDLIDDYLARLGRHLPADAMAELADGLAETYDRQVTAGLDGEKAAAAAIAEFGEPEVVLAAFVRQAPGRRAALVLLGCGPVVGACWATLLISERAWTWPVPAGLRLAFGLTLVAVVAALGCAATARTTYRRTRVSAPGCLVLLLLDAGLLATAATMAPGLHWPFALAAAASLTRMTLTVRALPRLLA